MDLKTTIVKTLLGEKVIVEESKYKHDLTDMGRSELWHKHEEHHHSANNKSGVNPRAHKKAADEIRAYVAKHHGAEMADDMHKHSELQTKMKRHQILQTRISGKPVGADKQDNDEAAKLRTKHRIKPGENTVTSTTPKRDFRWI